VAVAPMLNAATDRREQTVESFLYLADLREALTGWALCCTLRLRIGLQRQQSEQEAMLMFAVQEMLSCNTASLWDDGNICVWLQGCSNLLDSQTFQFGLIGQDPLVASPFIFVDRSHPDLGFLTGKSSTAPSTDGCSQLSGGVLCLCHAFSCSQSRACQVRSCSCRIQTLDKGMARKMDVARATRGHCILRQKCPHCGQIVVVLYLASQHAGNTNLNVNFASVTQIGYFLQAKHVVPLQLDMCTNNVV